MQFTHGLHGTVETGAVIGWREIRKQMPNAQLVVVRRDVEEVVQNLKTFDLPMDYGDIRYKAALLDELSEQPGVVTIPFKSLAQEFTCAWLYELCTKLTIPSGWWEHVSKIDIQIDLYAHTQKLIARKDAIERFKNSLGSVDARQSEFVIAQECWGSFWPECDLLGRNHFVEAQSGIEPKREYGLTPGLLAQASRAGAFRIFTARKDGKLVGYITWTISPDVESLGLLVADQGAWYVAPEAQGKGLARRLFDKSLADLKLLGVKNVFPHHFHQGRGAGLEKFFTRRGAKKVKTVYSLWIGD